MLLLTNKYEVIILAAVLAFAVIFLLAMAVAAFIKKMNPQPESDSEMNEVDFSDEENFS